DGLRGWLFADRGAADGAGDYSRVGARHLSEPPQGVSQSGAGVDREAVRALGAPPDAPSVARDGSRGAGHGACRGALGNDWQGILAVLGRGLDLAASPTSAGDFAAEGRFDGG